MCGRFVVYSAGEQLRDLLGLGETPNLSANYNLAITDAVPAVRLRKRDDTEDVRELVQLRWGLIPWWAEDEKIGHRCFNARSENVHDKPAFRDAFKQRRCLIVSNGFYEWKKVGKRREPYFIHLEGEQPFAFAGLWERFRRGEEVVESCTILTTTPNPLIASLHDRMPVILDPKDYALWLDSSVVSPALVKFLFAPYPADAMQMRPVSTAVNNVRAEGRALVAPKEPDRQQSLF